MKVSYSLIYSTSIYRVTTLLGTVPGNDGDSNQHRDKPHSLPQPMGVTDVEAGMIIPCGKCWLGKASQMSLSLQGESRSQVRAFEQRGPPEQSPGSI